MNTKQILRILILVLLAIFQACKDDSGNPVDDNNDIPSISNLEEDPLFIEYVELFNLTNNTFQVMDAEYVAELTEKYPNLNAQEKSDFASLFGFDSYEAYWRHRYNRYLMVRQLNEKYSLNKQDVNVLKPIYDSVFQDIVLRQLEKGHIFVTDASSSKSNLSARNNNDRVRECYNTERGLIGTRSENSCSYQMSNCIDPLIKNTDSFLNDDGYNDCEIDTYSMEQLDYDSFTELMESCPTQRIVDSHIKLRICTFDWQCCLFARCASDPGSDNDIPSNWHYENCGNGLIGAAPETR